MKKIIAVLLTMISVFMLALSAFAADGMDAASADNKISIYQKYIAVNSNSVNPAEQFNFTLEAKSVENAGSGITTQNMPLPSISSISYSKGEATTSGTIKEAQISLPVYDSVGVYSYTIHQTQGNTAGVSYCDHDMLLVVTVEQNETGKTVTAALHAGDSSDAEKTDTFEVLYDAGKLQFDKTVTGNLGDRSKWFQVAVRLSGEEGKSYQDSYSVTGGSNTSNPQSISIGSSAVFQIKHGETISIENLPYGVSYEIKEADYTTDGYVTSYAASDTANTVLDHPLESVSITNKKDTTVDTGIRSSVTTNLMLLGGIVAAAAVIAVILAKVKKSGNGR